MLVVNIFYNLLYDNHGANQRELWCLIINQTQRTANLDFSATIRRIVPKTGLYIFSCACYVVSNFCIHGFNITRAIQINISPLWNGDHLIVCSLNCINTLSGFLYLSLQNLHLSIMLGTKILFCSVVDCSLLPLDLAKPHLLKIHIPLVYK